MQNTIDKIKEEEELLLEDMSCKLEFIRTMKVGQRKKLVCHLIKKPRMFNVYGYVELPNGKGSKDAEILSAEVPIYYLRVEEIHMKVVGSKATNDRRIVETSKGIGIFMCGTTRHSVPKAVGAIKKSKGSFLVHIDEILSDSGFPLAHEFDEMFKAPIKRYAKDHHHVPGVLVNDRSTVVIGVEDLGNKKSAIR